jgi:transcriptional regulator with XRE-family HTH domain
MSDSVFKSEIAQHLKSERSKRGLSLDKTSQLTGVSKAMLGQIERQESSPTIATLWKISSGLNTSFSAFFATITENQSNERAFPNDTNMQVKTVFPFADDTNMEMFEITLSQHHKQMSSPHQVGVIEHVYVTNGQLALFFDEQWHTIETGGSLRFYADQEHGYQAITEKTTFQNIVKYPVK